VEEAILCSSAYASIINIQYSNVVVIHKHEAMPKVEEMLLGYQSPRFRCVMAMTLHQLGEKGAIEHVPLKRARGRLFYNWYLIVLKGTLCM